MLATPEEIAGWPSGSDTFVESFAKGLAVIAAFGDGAGALTISDVSKLTGLPRAGVRRLLLSLVALSLAEDHDGRFSLTPRVLRLGYAYLASLSLREIAQPLIETMARECDEIVAVSVLDGDELTYVSRAEPTSVLRRSLTVGSRLPAFCTSMGRVLLAGLSDEKAEALLKQASRPAYTRETITDLRKLMHEIGKIRQQGWAFVSQELELGACGIAAPIRDWRGRTVAALNISTNLGRHSEKLFVRQFKQRLIGLADRIATILPRD